MNNEQNFGEQPVITPAEQVAVNEAIASLNMEKAQDVWNDLVRGILVKAKKAKPEDVVLPTGHRGHYVKLAMTGDNFSMPSIRGRGVRKHPHWHPRDNARKSLALQIFKTNYSESLKVEWLDAAANGKPLPEELGPQETFVMMMTASDAANKILERNSKLFKRDHRRRQGFARRIANGLTAVNAAGARAYAMSAPAWADIQKLSKAKFREQVQKLFYAAPAAPVVAPVESNVEGSAQLE